MANLFEQIRRVKDMRKQAKEMQRQLEEMTAEYENAGVKIVVGGDMSVRSISITDKSVIDPEHPEKIERTLTENANKALKLVKSKAEDISRQAMKSMDLNGLGEMFKGM